MTELRRETARPRRRHELIVGVVIGGAASLLCSSPRPAYPTFVIVRPSVATPHVVVTPHVVAAPAPSVVTPPASARPVAAVSPSRRAACPPSRSDAPVIRTPAIDDEFLNAVVVAPTNAGWVAAWSEGTMWVSYDAGARFTRV